MAALDRKSAPPPWEEQVKAAIKRRYAKLAGEGAAAPDDGGARARLLSAGYSVDWLDTVPPGAVNAYSGCGFALHDLDLSNVRIAVDLGCGAGLDVRWLAENIGGRRSVVLALDLTPAMVRRARETCAGADGAAVLAIAADMEHVALPDGLADLVTANAALNLALDKARALGEAFRVLRPGGRLIARDLVLDGELPPEVAQDPMSWNTSLGGVLEETDLAAALTGAGFTDVDISDHRPFSYVQSVRVQARKPD